MEAVGEVGEGVRGLGAGAAGDNALDGGTGSGSDGVGVVAEEREQEGERVRTVQRASGSDGR
jgi:hypothetical protein